MRPILALALCTGCGFGLIGDDPGGADNLPTLGAGPFDKPNLDFDTPAEEPYVIVDRRASLTDPSALGRADGGFRIYYSRFEDDAPGAEIWVAEIPGVTELPDVAPAPALTATDAWEQDDVRAPSVVDLGDDRLVMYYQGGVADPAIGRADSDDGGATWVKHPGNPLVTGALAPSAVSIEGRFLLAFTQAGDPGIFLADSDDGERFSDTRIAVMASGAEDTFDELAVLEPCLVARETEARRVVYGLFYVGLSPGDEDIAAIGYAGSFDAVTWELLGTGKPVLQALLPSETGPGAVVGSTTATLFFSEPRQNRGRIAAAVHP